MKLSFSKDALESTLKVVGGTVSTSDRGLGGHYVFRQKDGKMAIYTSAGKLFSSSPLECEVDSAADVSFTIEAKRLNKWLRTVNGDLALSFSGGVVTASAMMGEVKFRSLDPDMFPWWDSSQAAATKSVTVDASNLADILGFVKPFCSSDDTIHPGMCSTEVVDSCFYATDNASLAVVRAEGFGQSNLRVWAKEISSAVRFLSTVEGSVDVYEHTNCFMFVSDSGALFGQARPEHAIPQIEVDPKQAYKLSETFWTFSGEDMKRSIDFLSVSAQEEDYSLTIKQVGEKLFLEMKAAAGGSVSVEIACQEVQGKEEVSIPVHFERFSKMLQQISDEPAIMGIKDYGGGSGIYIFHEDDAGAGSNFYLIGSFYNG